jgi:hypothetical protein
MLLILLDLYPLAGNWLAGQGIVILRQPVVRSSPAGDERGGQEGPDEPVGNNASEHREQTR